MKLVKWYRCYCFDCGCEWGARRWAPCPDCGSSYVEGKEEVEEVYEYTTKL